MSWHVSTFTIPTTDLTTLALIIYAVSPFNAHELWDRALANTSRGSPDEVSRLRRALGVKTGVVGLMEGCEG